MWVRLERILIFIVEVTVACCIVIMHRGCDQSTEMKYDMLYCFSIFLMEIRPTCRPEKMLDITYNYLLWPSLVPRICLALKQRRDSGCKHNLLVILYLTLPKSEEFKSPTSSLREREREGGDNWFETLKQSFSSWDYIFHAKKWMSKLTFFFPPYLIQRLNMRPFKFKFYFNIEHLIVINILPSYFNIG